MRKPPSEYSQTELLLRNMASGAMAGATSQCFVYPLDLARTRLSGDIGKTKKYRGVIHVMRHTVMYEGGFRALYSGFGISVAGIVPYRAVYFGGYDTLKYLFLNDKPSFWEKWAIAQGNTIIAQTFIYPIDTVRRRMMIKGELVAKGAVSANATLYRNSLHCIQVILKEEGFVGFWKGKFFDLLRLLNSQ